MDDTPEVAPVTSGQPHVVAEGHLVQFYERDDALVDSVASFLETGLRAGEGAIVIATLKHRDALVATLQESGFDLFALQESGTLVLLDAADTLGKFLLNGSPDEVRFNQVIGGVVKRAARNRTGLRAFGEMVALLWWSRTTPMISILFRAPSKRPSMRRTWTR